MPSALEELLASRRRIVLVPDALKLICDHLPNPMATILNRIDVLGIGPEENEVVRDDSARRITPPLGIREAQRDLVAHPTPRLRSVPDA